MKKLLKGRLKKKGEWKKKVSIEMRNWRNYKGRKLGRNGVEKGHKQWRPNKKKKIIKNK